VFVDPDETAEVAGHFAPTRKFRRATTIVTEEDWIESALSASEG
jgi:hypothetical protein